MGLGLGDLMRMKGAWESFSGNHPKFPEFIDAVGRYGVQEGTVIELKVAEPDGKVFETNIRVKQSDMELLSLIRELGRS